MKRKGFTLIELLVVVAIIALLLSILLPGLKAAKQQAAASICLAHSKQILASWILYASEHDSILCGPGTGNPGKDNYDWIAPPVVSTNNGYDWEEEVEGIRRGSLFKYYEAAELVHCPMDTRYLKPPTNPGYVTQGDGGYRTFSFLLHVNQLWNAAYASSGWAQEHEIYKKLSEIQSAGSKFVMLEENDNRGINAGAWVMDRVTPAFVDPFAVYHNMRSIMGYADGHAEKQIWKDKRTEQYSKGINNGSPTFRSTAEVHGNNEDLRFLASHYASK